MLLELNTKNTNEIKQRSHYHKMDYNSFLEEVLDNKNRLQYEIFIREERMNDVHLKISDIIENNTTIIDGTIEDELYELQQEEKNIQIEINLLKYLFKELI